jgi:hypothetical protein
MGAAKLLIVDDNQDVSSVMGERGSLPVAARLSVAGYLPRLILRRSRRIAGNLVLPGEDSLSLLPVTGFPRSCP